MEEWRWIMLMTMVAAGMAVAAVAAYKMSDVPTISHREGDFKLATYNDAILSDDADVISLNAYSTCPLEAAIRRKTTNKSAYVNDILSALA